MEVSSSLPDYYTDYLATLATKAPGTVDVYRRILRQFIAWLADRPGAEETFQPAQLTETALHTYLKEREAAAISISHCTRVKTVIGSFARYLVEERGVLARKKGAARERTTPAAACPTCARCRSTLCAAFAR